MDLPVADRTDQEGTGCDELARNLTKRLSLRANFAWTFLGNLVYAGCQWGMLIVLAKLGSPEAVGQFALGLAVTAPVMMFAGLQLRALQATDVKRRYQFGSYLALRLLTTGLALLAVAGLTLAGGYGPTVAAVILAVGLAKAFESCSDVFYGLLQRQERMDRVTRSLILRGLLALAAMAGGIWLTGSVLGGAAGVAAVWALTLALHDAPCGLLALRAADCETKGHPSAPPESLAPRWDWLALARLTRLGLPLGMVMMLISLNNNLPRYFLEAHLGERELGIFAAISYLMIAENTIMGAWGQAASPALARCHAQGRPAEFRALALKLAGLAVLLGAGGVAVALAAGPQLLGLLYGPEYAAHGGVLVLVMVAAGLMQLASALGYAATARRRLRYQPAALLAVVATSATLCYALVPRGGLEGAGVALVASAAVCAAAYAVLLSSWGAPDDE